MSKLQEIGESIKANIPKILEEWRKLKQQEPWLSLPEEYHIDHLPDAIGSLVDAALGTAKDEEVHRRQVWAAATHGHDRLEQGFPEHLLFTEHHLLRRALRRFVEHHHGTSRESFEAILRLDAATTVSTVASLRGYHRAALERRGDWPGAIDRLAEREFRLHLRAESAT